MRYTISNDIEKERKIVTHTMLAVYMMIALLIGTAVTAS